MVERGRIGIMVYRSDVVILKTQPEFNLKHYYVVCRIDLSFLLSKQYSMALQNHND